MLRCQEKRTTACARTGPLTISVSEGELLDPSRASLSPMRRSTGSPADDPTAQQPLQIDDNIEMPSPYGGKD